LLSGIPGCFEAYCFLNQFHESAQFGKNPINRDPETMKHSVLADPKFEINIICKTSIEKSFQQTAPIPNVDVIQGSGITK
jgi:hypothetical protein